MDMGFFLQKERIFPGVHKIDAPISGPRIEDKNFTDTRIFLKLGQGPQLWEEDWHSDRVSERVLGDLWINSPTQRVLSEVSEGPLRDSLSETPSTTPSEPLGPDAPYSCCPLKLLR